MRTPALLGLIGLALATATSARAGELTGTYAGSLSCGLQGAQIATAPSLVRISERASSPEGSSLVVEVDGLRYSGRAANGDAAFTLCGAINAGYGDRENGFEQVSYGVAAATGAMTLHVRARFGLGVCEATWTQIDGSEPDLLGCGQ